jgi:hypothetical protein
MSLHFEASLGTSPGRWYLLPLSHLEVVQLSVYLTPTIQATIKESAASDIFVTYIELAQPILQLIDWKTLKSNCISQH